MSVREAVIVGAVRTPVGRRGGILSAWHPVDLLGQTLRELVARAGVDPAAIEDVITGCVIQHDVQSGNLGRHAVLAAGLPESVPAVTIDRQCGSGQQAVSFAAQAVMAGSHDLVIACGVESMSRVPMPPAFLPGAPLGPQYSPRELDRYDGGLMAQGPSSELMNERFDLSRAALDAFSARSHERAHAATRAGKFRDQMVPITADPDDPTGPVIDSDEGIREHIDPAKMASLKAVFGADGRTTAANSSQISDGAAALLIADREYAERNGLIPRARFRALSVAAADPIIQFTAILDAAHKALGRSGLAVEEIDLFEVNEAFAGVPLIFQREFGVPDDKLNVNGGSVALGHPLGSTGARMLTDLLCELERSGKRFGLQTVCEATGTANATIIERTEDVMSHEIVRGLPSTHGDHYQLNTTTIIRHAARTYPEQEIVYRTADGGWDRYTYADAYARIQRSANALRSIGVGPGDVVGILDWNSKRHYELYWAIPGLAAVMLQMNLRLAPEDLAYVTGHSDASVVLIDESLLPVAEALAPHTPNVKTWVVMTDKPLADITTTLPHAVHWEDLLADAGPEIDWPVIDETSSYSACYTTGTTGRPKGIYYSHRGIYLHTLAEVAGLGMSSDDAVMLITPMFHGQGWGLPQAAAYSAAKIVLPGRYIAEDTSVLVDAMIAEQVTVANGAPAIFQPMMNYIKTLAVAPDFSRARLLSGATEPPLSLMRDFHDITGADVIHAYGATETTPLVAVNRGLKPSLRGVISDEEKWDLKRKQGLPVNGIDIRIVDAEGNDLPHDGTSQGEVLLRGPWIIERYHKLDDDADKFLDGYWRSGDVGTIDPNGYLKITDRIKDVVKSGGEWISSIDMENALVAHPKIAEAAVIGVPHPKWQERPVALVVTTDGQELPLSEIHELLADAFAKWQLPETVLYLDQLPRTSVGKLDKKAMRAAHTNVYEDVR